MVTSIVKFNLSNSIVLEKVVFPWSLETIKKVIKEENYIFYFQSPVVYHPDQTFILCQSYLWLNLEQWLKHSSAYTYADDTSSSVTGKSIEEVKSKLEEDANQVLF